MLAKALERTLRYKLGLMPLHASVIQMTDDNVIGTIDETAAMSGVQAGAAPPKRPS